jgi:ribosome assembly protein 1
MPVAESFGFADELFTTSSGAAHGQLAFSHWEVLDQDPNFVPTTEEELEDSGAYNLASFGNNLARTYIDNVRLRKVWPRIFVAHWEQGLPIKRKLVEHSNKQRTLSKKR